jgi:hypothetical protein
LRKEVTEGVIQERQSGLGIGPYTWELMRKLGAKGWLTPTWPKEYGGLNASPMYRYIIENELDYFGGLPGGRLVGASMAGPTILLYGTEQQKKEYLPKIARGEIEFVLGYTEPDAGSDLAALQMRAVEDGDYYIINGQKTFNTRAHYAQYHWLAARTDPKAPKHKGISLFIVDLKTPGITVHPIWTVGGTRTNQVYYDDVKVPRENLVGEKNRGFYHIATALDFERIFAVGGLKRSLEELVDYVQREERQGTPLGKRPFVRQNLAELAIQIEVAQVLAYRVIWLLSQEIVPNYEAAMLKAFATELRQRIDKVALQIMGLFGQLQSGSLWAPLEGKFEHYYRDDLLATIVGGTSEIMRNIIATRGLKLPRS